MENTANPKAAVNQGRIARLAKLVDQITLGRTLLCRLRDLGIGIEEVEHQASKWEQTLANGTGEFQGMEGRERNTNS